MVKSIITILFIISYYHYHYYYYNKGIDFGQKVDLTASIRNILRNYPEGTAVLKELVQNADDAGARTVSFCLDCRYHGTEKLADTALQEFQGPSLLAYNDAIFTDEDFKSIQRIGDSLKKSAESKAKIGRFGIGFNAVYHWTDLPSFISSKYLVMLDPQAAFLPNVNPSNPGKMVDWITDPTVTEKFRDQFVPYEGHVGLNFKKPFEGTLFRLPLRTVTQAETSMLSKRALSVDNALELLEHMRIEASAMLLFLKSVENIEIKVWNENELTPVTLFRCGIHNISPEIRKKRAFVADISADNGKDRFNTADYSLTIQCEHNGKGSYIENWEVCNQLGGKLASVIAADPVNKLLRLVPWGGVAACTRTTAIQDVDPDSRPVQSGLAYCFLPLPIQTGLPVMVNGFFELSSNRRDVWQAGADMTGDGRTRAEWNISLMKDVIAPSYVRLLLRLRDSIGFTEIFQELWPSNKVPTPWSYVSLSVLQGAASEALLFVEDAETIKNVTVVSAKATNDIVPGFVTGALSLLGARSDGQARGPVTPRGWIVCRDAVLIPDSTDLNRVDVDSSQLILFLKQARQPLVQCVSKLRNTLADSKTCMKLATPPFVRKILRECGSSSNGVKYKPPVSMCTFLLYYCLSDCSADKPSTDLDQLSILPLVSDMTGTLRMFTAEQSAAIANIGSMGFSLSASIWALSRSKFNIEQACDLLANDPVSSFSNNEGTLNDDSILIISDEETSSVFKLASNILLDRSKIGAKEIDFLGHPAMQKVCNIRTFKANLVPDLLRFILPTTFFANVAVIGDTLNELQLDKIKNFLSKFWIFASLHPDVISAIAEGPALVPSLDMKQFLPLSKMSNLIVNVKGDVKLSSSMQDILQILGINIVDSLALPDKGSMPSVFWQYVHGPSRSGILHVVDAVMKNRPEAFQGLSSEQKDHLRLHIASCEPVKHISDAEAEIIRKIPIFKLYSISGSYTAIGLRTVKNQKANLSISPLNTISDDARLAKSLFPEYFISHQTPQDLQLLDILGVKVLRRSTYFKEELLPNIANLYESSPIDVENDVHVMLTELNSLLDEDRQFATYLKTVKFLPSGTKIDDDEMYVAKAKMYSPLELFDPHVYEFKTLLDPTFFPAEKFQKDDILVFLRTLGLQSSLGLPGVVACAKSVANMTEISESNINKKLERGQCLLRFLDKNISSLIADSKKASGGFSIFGFRSFFGEKQADPGTSVEQYLEQLINISWVPVLTKPLKVFMPWLSIDVSVSACPCDTRPLSDSWLCSSTKRIVSENIFSESLQKIFGWSSELDVHTIAIQLRNLAKTFKSINLADATEMQAAKVAITGLIPQLYQRLNNSAEEHKVKITALLQAHEWIWVGDAFVETNRIAISSSINASPYLYQLPQDFKVYNKLLTIFQVKASFTPRDYIQVLRQMATDTNAVVTEPSSAITPLSDTSIDLAVSLVTLLSAEGGINPAVHEVYIPDNTGRLVLSTELVNDDVPWMSGPEYKSIRVGCKLIHPNISSFVAEKMGVKSLRLAIVTRSLEQTIFNDMDDNKNNIEAFGQAESLTSRLKTILDLYPDGNPILSELIQNADDAGATELRIMLDLNTYPSESLLDSRMSPLQGPSLIVSNNAVFTEADFRSLASIGQGSKIEKLSTTGRFGLGFSSTYHLTDTPTFVSGEHLVIFDPHCAFAPGASLNQPGLRIKFRGSTLKATFPHQFMPFEFFGCDFNNAYDGTLFRFPLRSPALARRSEISKRSYTIADVEANLEQLKGQLANHLIFLRSIKSIEIYKCQEGDKVPTLLHRATSNTRDVQMQNDTSLMQFFRKDSNTAPSREQFYKKLFSTPDSKLPLMSFKVNVLIETFETEKPSQENALYFIVSGFGGGEAKRLACDESMRHLKLVPMGSVAACMSKIGSNSLQPKIFPSITGQAFCFLPLPINTTLPVHLNAYWELSSNRRDIWQAEDTKGEAKLRSEWNNHVMHDILAPLYSYLLIQAGNLCNQSSIKISDDASIPVALSDIFSLFPCPTPKEPWDKISSSLFPLLRNERLLHSNLNGGTQVQFKDAIVIELISDVKNEDTETRTKLEEILIKEKLPVVFVSSTILKSLLQSNCVAGEVNPDLVRKHFSTLQRKQNYPTLSLENGTVNDIMLNATFLLNYCCKDISRHNYEALRGLQLLPLEDKTLGTFGSTNDTPLFIVSDIERKLLEKAGNKIVCNDAMLGSLVANCIRDPAFTSTSNIKSISHNDVIDLLETFLPSTFFNDRTIVCNRDGIVTDDWLRLLWQYILDNKLIDLIRDKLAILPVAQPPGMEPGNYVVKVSDKIPVLHMSYKDIPPLAAGALADLGLYLFDSIVLGGISYAQEMSKLLCAPTVRGVLDAINSVKERIPDKPWSDEISNSIKDFILDSLLAKIEKLHDSDIQVLCELPIWTQYGTVGKHINKIDLNTTQLPPKDVDTSLLGKNYLYLRSEKDRSLFHLLGIKEKSKGEFYSNFVIPRALNGDLEDSSIDSLVLEILRNLTVLESEHPGFSSLLSDSALFRNQTGTLCSPTFLFDPHGMHLLQLLPPDLFPSSAISSDNSFLASLRKLGLNSSINCDGVTRAAASIEEDYQKVKSNKEVDGNGDKIKDLVTKASALMNYIETQIDSLTKEAERNFSNSPKRENSDFVCGGFWGKELRSLSWIPVYTELPSGNFDCLPWSPKIHNSTFATPSQSVPYDYMFACSSTSRISKVEVKSDMLKSLLGWDKLISGRNAALQLLNIVEDFNSSPIARRERLKEGLYNVIPKIFSSLSAAFERESPIEIAVWMKILQGKSLFWLGGQFVESNRLAFEQLSSLNAEPFLFVVRGEMLQHEKLLRPLGVKDAFSAFDLAQTLRDMKEKYNGIPLPHNCVEISSGICKVLARLIRGESIHEQEKKHDDDDFSGSVVTDDDDEEDEMDPDIKNNNVDNDDNVVLKHSNEDGIDFGDPKDIAQNTDAPLNTISIDELGPIYIVDRDSILFLSSQLVFDDAPWISSALLNRNSTIKFIHKDLDMDDAKVLGAQSLREQLFCGDDIVCPNPEAIKSLIKDDTIQDALTDILALTDKLGAQSIDIMFDERTHPSESLMHPGLADAQGPALVIHIDGPVLSVEEVAQILTSPHLLPALIDDSNGSNNYMKEKNLYPTSGKRLMSSFAITDCLQIISGREFYVFDPCSQYLLSSVEESTIKTIGRSKDRKGKPKVSRPIGRAQRCLLLGSRKTGSKQSSTDQEVLFRFPDQFSSFLSLPFGLQHDLKSQGLFQGILIRMPLRTSPSLISDNITAIHDIKTAFCAHRYNLYGALLFGNTLMKGTCLHWNHNEEESKTDFEVLLLSSHSARSERWQNVQDKGWKRSGITSLFSKAFVPPELKYSLDVSTKVFDCTSKSQEGSVGWLCWQPSQVPSSNDFVALDSWTIWSICGAGRLRDLAASEPYRSLKLQPFVTIAMKELNNESDGEKLVPETGLYYCGGGTVGVSGLPCHIEGPFLQNFMERNIPLHKGSSSGGREVSLSVGRLGSSQNLSLSAIQAWNTGIISTAFEYLLSPALIQMFSSTPNSPSARLIYKLWPFMNRMTSATSYTAVQSKLHNQLASSPLYLTSKGFQDLKNVVLPINELPKNVLSYMQTMLPVANVPVQITKDLQASQVKFSSLTPARLRDSLKTDAANQCLRLKNRYELLIPLLKYAISDLQKSTDDGEFARRNSYKQISGTPLLPMADGSVRIFPKTARDSVALAPLAFHAFLPTLRKSFLHATALKDISLISDSLFMDTTFIGKFSPSFLRDNIEYIIPNTWKKIDAVKWITTDNEARAGRGLRKVTDSQIIECPTEAMMYVLWKDVLTPEPMPSFDGLNQWPLIPIISKGKRLLLSAALLPHVFSTMPTSQEDDKRSYLNKEVDRLGLLVQQEAQQNVVHINDEHDQTWDWASNPAPYPSVKALSKSNVVKPSNEIVSDNNPVATVLGVPVSSSVHTVTGVPFTGAAVVANEVVGHSVEDASLDDVEVAVASNSEETESSLSALPQTLISILNKLGVPFLDGSIFDRVPKVINDRSRVSTGKRILESLHEISSLNVTIHYISESNNQLLSDGELLSFKNITTANRNDLLLEIYKSHRVQEFTSSEIEKLKSIKLFTSKDGNPVSISQSNGAYWCSNDSVLEGVSLSDLNSDILPTILINEPALREIYTLVGVEELTPSTTVRRFILPTLPSLHVSQRLDIMRNLASKWGTFRDDEALLKMLREIAFIPRWEYSCNESNENIEILVDGSPRRANELFLWTNDDLLEALNGPTECSYFPPPSLRLPELHPMFSDLEMSSELKKETLLKLANDIQTKSLSDSGDGLMKQVAAERGRRLLRYIKENDRCSSIPLDSDLSKKLGKIQFVPLSFPVSVQAGGHVVYKNTVGSFDKVLAKTCGALGFTVQPVLAEDISPPQFFFSSLGITTVPSRDLVLKHINNLTAYGDLDRWNNPMYSLRATFAAIFQFLLDNWRDIPLSVKTSLSTTNIVPVGHTLIKPSRLFFRLAEDLSPFMHEIPRYFGQHEQLLKNLGVKETPSASDYIQFLRDLANECKQQSLNPNELRAVIAIIQCIAIQKEEDIELSNSTGNYNNMVVYVPDENSVLRESFCTLINDDIWLKSRAMGIADIGLHFIHPAITNATAESLGILKLTAVVIEKMPISTNGDLESHPDETNLSNNINAVLGNIELKNAIASLCIGSRSQTSSLIDTSSVHSRLESIKFNFLTSLPTKLFINDPRNHSEKGIELKEAGSVDGGLSFVDKSQTPHVTVFVNMSLVQHPVTVEAAISIALCQILELDISIASSLSFLLTSPPSNLATVLTSLRVGVDSATVRERLRGHPGERLTAADESLLELKPFRVFRQGEIVAYDLNAKSGPVSENILLSSLRYGKIIHVDDNKGEAGLKRLLVKTGDGTSTMLTTQIYSFSSARTVGEKGSSSDSSRQSFFKSPSQDTAKLKSSAQVKQEKTDPVSKEEIMDCLQGLLIRAGIPASIQTKDLMAKLLDQERNNKRLEDEVKNERTQLTESRDALTRANAAFKCQICIAVDVTHVMVPCGHTICGNCVTQLQRNQCPYCRKTFSQKIKIFMNSAQETHTHEDD